MKIGGARDGVLYATRGRTVGTWTPAAGFEARSTLPAPGEAVRDPVTALASHPLPRRLLRPLTGRFATTNVWPVGDRGVLATVGRDLYRSADGGRSWTQVHTLPADSGPMGALPTSLCDCGDVLLLAEYSLGDGPARILRSSDGGQTWTTALETDAVRHFHGVFADPFSETCWATAGDADRACAIGRLEDGSFRPVGGGDQRWRAVGLAFTPDAVLWGMDCSFCDPIRVFRLPRSALDRAAPEPEPVQTVDCSVFYFDRLTVDGDHWVVLATAAETGLDRVAPPGARNTCSRVARVLAASSRSDFETWHELGAFARKRTVGDYLSAVPAASAYVYLASDPAFGLALNPYNTVENDGAVLTVGEDRFREAAFPRAASLPS